MINTQFKRAFLTSDWHFGCRSNSKEWLYLQQEYFENIFIPFLKKHATKDDFVLHLGDVYDNRQSIESHINNVVIDIVEQIANIVPFWVIAGNHDIYRNTTNEITSLKSIKHIDGVKVFTQPEMFTTPQTKNLLMPWRKDINQANQTLDEFDSGDYLFCHTDFHGAKLNRVTKIDREEGVVIDESFKYDRIYSGHIHLRQTLYNKRLNFIGNPYQMTRTDRGNSKGMYILDFENKKHSFFENNFSPKWLQFDLNEFGDMPLGEFLNKTNNNFVDLIANKSILYNTKIVEFIEYLISGNHARRVELDTYIDTYSLDYSIDDYEFGGSLDIKALLQSSVETRDYNDKLSNKLLQHLYQIYKEAQQNEIYT